MANAKTSDAGKVEEIDPKVMAEKIGGKVTTVEGRKVIQDVVKHKSGDIIRRTFIDSRKA
jgi:hypothetical protein